jgi:RNA ligase
MVYSNRIEDYMEAIAGCDAFFVADRDYGRIINYRQMGNDVFPDPAVAPDEATARLWGLRRQCRGIIFDLAGNVISPGFEKFFNLGERTETLLENIPFDVPHVIMEKLDGSLIRPVPMADGGYRLGTKMGLTDVAAQPEAWLRDHANYDGMIRDMLGQGLVPLFEWCSRKQRIVIDYPEDRLVLLAVRDVRTGEYLPLNMMLELAVEYGVEVVRRYEGTPDSMQHLMEETQGILDQEGWVVTWPHLRVKIKGESYLRIHRTKENLVRENNVIEMILDEVIDDVKPFLHKDDLLRLESYEIAFWHGINATVHAWSAKHKAVCETYGEDRKAFALGEASNMDGFMRAALFKAWADTQFDFYEYLIDVLKKSISTQTKVDAARYLWGGVTWAPQEMSDD